MKKFMNEPRKFVADMLKGIELANPGQVKYIPDYNFIMRADAPNDDKVSILQGSGSGHEPSHVMLVGKGMLDGACPGEVFAGPPVDFPIETSKILNSKKGVLHIVNNYTGDVAAFRDAAEELEDEGISVQTVLVDDDVAVKDSLHTVGRRGVPANFFVIKACGAAAEEGASLDEVAALGRRVNDVSRSMGVALTGCTPPVKGEPIFTLAEDEMEFGVGIHGEPGRARVPMKTARETVSEVLEAILTDRKPTSETETADPVFNSGDEVALMINGLGGTPISEQYILYGEAHEQLEAKGIKVWRSYVGEYCTSLEMAGMFITLVKVDEELKKLFMAPADIPYRVF